MLTHTWIITQTLGQTIAVILLLIVVFKSLPILMHWNRESASFLQLKLERRTYLISTIIQFVFWYQIAGLLLFLITVNNILPGSIKGAMCATGVLSVNIFGYPLLWIKLIAVIVYAQFLFLNRMDGREPLYPLTPNKYYWLFPALLLVIADFILSLLYFSKIEPDIIATCCSISFSTAKDSSIFFIAANVRMVPMLIFFYLSFALLVISVIFFNRGPELSFVISLGFTTTAVFLLKNHFVKYIYGLPSHNCLFDIFWGRYYYIGYILFSALIISLICSLLLLTLKYIEKGLSAPVKPIRKILQWGAVLGSTLFTLLCSIYWLNWIFLD